jgi:hypothetical protein
MTKRILIALVLVIVGYLVAQYYLLPAALIDSFPVAYARLLLVTAVILPPLFYVIFGRRGLLYGAILALAYNILDIVFLKEYLFADSLPQTMVDLPNVFGVGPINAVYLIAGLVLFFKKKAS